MRIVKAFVANQETDIMNPTQPPQIKFAISIVNYFNNIGSFCDHFVEAGEYGILWLRWNGSWDYSFFHPEKVVLKSNGIEQK